MDPKQIFTKSAAPGGSIKRSKIFTDLEIKIEITEQNEKDARTCDTSKALNLSGQL